MRIPLWIAAVFLVAYLGQMMYVGVRLLHEGQRQMVDYATLECMTFSDGRVICQTEGDDATD